MFQYVLCYFVIYDLVIYDLLVMASCNSPSVTQPTVSKHWQNWPKSQSCNPTSFCKFTSWLQNQATGCAIQHIPVPVPSQDKLGGLR